MAKVIQETVVITLSRLVKTGEAESKDQMASADVVSALEQVVQELVGNNVVVEVEGTK